MLHRSPEARPPARAGDPRRRRRLDAAARPLAARGPGRSWPRSWGRSPRCGPAPSAGSNRLARLLPFARFLMLPVRRLADEHVRAPARGCCWPATRSTPTCRPTRRRAGSSAGCSCRWGSDVGFPSPVGGAGELAGALVRRLRARGGASPAAPGSTGWWSRAGGPSAWRSTAARAGRPGGAGRCRRRGAVPRLVGADLLPAAFVDTLDHFQRGWGRSRSTGRCAARCPGATPTSPGGDRAPGRIDRRAGHDGCAEVMAGRLPAHPFVVLGQMTTTDPSGRPRRDRVGLGLHPRARPGRRRAWPPGPRARRRRRDGPPRGAADRGPCPGLPRPDPGPPRAPALGHGGARRQPGGRRHDRRDQPAPSAAGVPPDSGLGGPGHAGPRPVPGVVVGAPRRRGPWGVRHQRRPRRPRPRAPPPACWQRSRGSQWADNARRRPPRPPPTVDSGSGRSAKPHRPVPVCRTGASGSPYRPGRAAGSRRDRAAPATTRAAPKARKARSHHRGSATSSRTWWIERRWWSTTPSTTLNIPQPSSRSPTKGRGSRRAPWRSARQSSTTPITVTAHVPAWKMPSQSVLASRSSTVPGGSARRALVGEQVVPLQDLVQDDAVDEPAEPHPEQQPAGGRPRPSGQWWRSRAPPLIGAASCPGSR